MQRWVRILHVVGVMLGALVVVIGVWRCLAEGKVSPLLIALAVIIAGPLEDLLTHWAKRRRPADQTLLSLIDAATSVGFLLCLGAACIMT